MIILDSSNNCDPQVLANGIKSKNPDLVVLPKDIDEARHVEMVQASKGYSVIVNRRDQQGTNKFFL